MNLRIFSKLKQPWSEDEDQKREKVGNTLVFSQLKPPWRKEDKEQGKNKKREKERIIRERERL